MEANSRCGPLLVDASTNEVLRQTAIDATPSYTPVARSLTFPSYDVPEGRRLLLQLQVAPSSGVMSFLD